VAESFGAASIVAHIRTLTFLAEYFFKTAKLELGDKSKSPAGCQSGFLCLP
jgi:hypothetical protein